MELSKRVVCVVGPTASGKSELAQLIAEQVDGEVVSADSMQVYRGMDIGTGKVVAGSRRVRHHCLDIVEPGRPYSAALFQEDARAAFRDIDQRGKRSILCGGTGFYVRAAIDDYNFPAGNQVDNKVRDRYQSFAERNGAEALWKLLYERDEASARIIPPNDVKRLVRAFELLADGTTYARQKEKLASIPQAVPAMFFGMGVDAAVLRARIDRRVDEMFEAGLVNEVQALLDEGLREAITAPQAIGYKEIVEALDGRCNLDEAREAIKIATRRYAKRQRTWFRKDKRITWLDATTLRFDDMAEQILASLLQSSKAL